MDGDGRREGAVLRVNEERPIETNRGLYCAIVRERRTLPKLLW